MIKIAKFNQIPAHHHAIIKEKLYLTNMIDFCVEMTGLIDEGSALNVAYLNISKVFDTVH